MPRVHAANVRPQPELTLRAGGPHEGSVRGRVVSDGDLVPGMRLVLRSRDLPTWVEAEVDPESGRFERTRTAPSQYAVRLVVPGRPVRELGRVPLAAGEARDLGFVELPPAGGLALLVRGPGGELVRPSDLVLAGEGTVFHAADDAAAFEIDREGRARVPAAWPGAYLLTVEAPGLARLRHELVIESGRVTELELDLEPGSPVELRVASRTPLPPASRLELRVLDVDREVVFERRPWATPAPDLVCAQGLTLAVGSYRAVAVGPDGLLAEAEFQVLGDAAPVLVELDLE